MKIYIDADGNRFKTRPDPYKGFSPMSDEKWRALGGTIEENEDPTPEQEFETACAQFRQVCAAIGEFIGNPNFHGGFGEYMTFATSEAYQANPVQGNALAIQWSAANEAGKYFGSKIGLGQPKWWYRAWELGGVTNP